jgi:hypothetical protein
MTHGIPHTKASLSGPGDVSKAYRRVAEMEQIAEFIADPSVGAAIYEGAARLYEAIAVDLLDGQPQDRFAGLTRIRAFILMKSQSRAQHSAV